MGNEQGSCFGKFALAGGSGCFGTIFGMILGCVVCIYGLLWIGQFPQGVTVSVDAPLQVDIGDKVKFVVTVTNHGEDIVEIASMDIDPHYFDGITLLSVSPDYDSYYMPEDITAWDDVQSYYFSIPIESEETVSVTFVGNAVTAGDYGGILDVCINSDFSCISKVLRTVVK